MSSLRFFGSGRAAVAIACFAALGAVACGGRSNKNSAAAGSSGTAGESGGMDASGGAPAQGGQLTGGASSGAASGGTASGGAANGGAGGLGGDPDAWTLPHTSDKPWRQSLEPLCAPEGTGLPWDLWSDERGLYVLSEMGLGETRLHFNDGTGWSVLRQSQPNFFGLSGFENGPLVLYSGRPCGVLFQDGDVDVCASTLPNINRVFVVDASRTFAVAGNRVLRYNGDYFTQYGKTLPQDATIYGLWADAEVVIAASDQDRIYILPDADSEAKVLTMPAGNSPRSLWAFARDDIWVGMEENRLAHYDGASWTVETFGNSCGAVTTLWGIDHVLFFASNTFVGKVQAGVAQLIAGTPRCDSDVAPGAWEELSFRKIWGNSPSEVFFAVTERRLELRLIDESFQTIVTDPDACGMQRLYWYDGTRVRPL